MQRQYWRSSRCEQGVVRVSSRIAGAFKEIAQETAIDPSETVDVFSRAYVRSGSALIHSEINVIATCSCSQSAYTAALSCFSLKLSYGETITVFSDISIFSKSFDLIVAYVKSFL